MIPVLNLSDKVKDANLAVARASTPVKHISLRAMLPDTEHFMTYEGSTTHPGCWETTVWIILNKPIYITKHELYQLRKLMQGSADAPKAPLGNNARPVQPLHQRTIRTNINFKNAEVNNCPSMHKEMYYKANKWPQNIKDHNPFHSLHSFPIG
ncbi:hypothetical protein GWI33_009259 [Rhynchophorus ferrugineus]|uniref:Alpha-carbonic anhydrase domain-containing protein n=1 Tax=Rhynchophorus ferrugineus TaxID=354439 RepID=A0A834MDK2_RHYFE|nr:hypothetical protein GWI33_009259 [Rhynchophorus ferrugineus]